jgi:alanine racemase
MASIPGLRPTWLEINLDNLAHNMRETRKLVREGTLIMAVVKGDAYGHGAVASAKVFLENGADWLGVATLTEALELRKAGYMAPILVLGYTPENQYVELVEADVRAAIYNVGHAASLSKVAMERSRRARIHIKIDSGLGRIGFLPNEQSISDIMKISRLPGVEVEGIFTHFAVAGSPDKSYTRQQFNRFMWVVEELRRRGLDIPLKHASASQAIIDLPEYNLDMVRAGTMLYALFSTKELSENKAMLRPALTLKTRISNLKTVPSGTGISYGLTFTTKRESKIGTLPIGFADGYKSILSNKGYVGVRGSRVPVVGVVCMDQLMIDLTEVEGVEVGDEVVLFGYGDGSSPRIDEFAAWADTHVHEIACSITRRVPRVYVSGGKVVKVVDYLLA